MKRILMIAATLVLLIALSLSLAVPAMGSTIYNISLSLSASPTEVCEGGTSQLTVTLQNAGPYTLGSVSLALLGYTLVPISGVHNWNDTGDLDGLLEPGEIWTWQVDTPPINANTQFTVTGAGKLTCGCCWNDCASVTVCVEPCPPPPPPPPPVCHSPGYWKNHTDVWPGGISPDDTWDATFPEYAELFEGSLLQALRARGHGSEFIRNSVANLLNSY
jgi:hypothetical protein